MPQHEASPLMELAPFQRRIEQKSVRLIGHFPPTVFSIESLLPRLSFQVRQTVSPLEP